MISEICKKSHLVGIDSLEDDFGDVEILSSFINKTEQDANDNLTKITETQRIYHSLTHPDVVKAFLKVFKKS